MGEAVFKQVFIPRRLNEVAKPERDIRIMKTGGNLGVEDYSAVTGLNDNTTDVKDQSDASYSDSDEDSDEEEKAKKGFTQSRRPKEESKEEKAERKKAVKEAKAEKRKEKIPKHMKKRKE